MKAAQSLLAELREIQGLKESIRRNDEQIEALEAAALRTTQGIRVGSRGTTSHDAVGDAVAAAHTAINEALGLRGEYLLRILKAEECMDALELKPQYRAILHAIYIDGMTRTAARIPDWPRISRAVGYVERYCQQLWREAKETVRFARIPYR
jgi:hypothetical protein